MVSSWLSPGRGTKIPLACGTAKRNKENLKRKEAKICKFSDVSQIHNHWKVIIKCSRSRKAQFCPKQVCGPGKYTLPGLVTNTPEAPFLWFVSIFQLARWGTVPRVSYVGPQTSFLSVVLVDVLHNLIKHYNRQNMTTRNASCLSDSNWMFWPPL